MSATVPIAIPEEVTPVGLLKRQIKAYEDAIAGAQNQNHVNVLQWKREVVIWRQVLKREEARV